MEHEPTRIVVVGAGGMGALFGAILQEGGLTVTLYDVNTAHVEAIHRDGLRIEGVWRGPNGPDRRHVRSF